MAVECLHSTSITIYGPRNCTMNQTARCRICMVMHHTCNNLTILPAEEINVWLFWRQARQPGNAQSHIVMFIHVYVTRIADGDHNLVLIIKVRLWFFSTVLTIGSEISQKSARRSVYSIFIHIKCFKSSLKTNLLSHVCANISLNNQFVWFARKASSWDVK